MLHIVGLAQRSLAALEQEQEQREQQRFAGQRWPWFGHHCGSSVSVAWVLQTANERNKSKCCKLAQSWDRRQETGEGTPETGVLVSIVVTQLATTTWPAASSQTIVAVAVAAAAGQAGQAGQQQQQQQQVAKSGLRLG